MVIKSLKLKNYRNYDLLDMKFDPNTNILYGDNAQGKTNILEAIYLSGTTKSHRGTKDRDMIQFGHDESHLETIVEKKRRSLPDRHASEEEQPERDRDRQDTDSACQRTFRYRPVCVFFSGRSEYHQGRSGRTETVHRPGTVSA